MRSRCLYGRGLQRGEAGAAFMPEPEVESCGGGEGDEGAQEEVEDGAEGGCGEEIQESHEDPVDPAAQQRDGYGHALLDRRGFVRPRQVR